MCFEVRSILSGDVGRIEKDGCRKIGAGVRFRRKRGASSVSKNGLILNGAVGHIEEIDRRMCMCHKRGAGDS